LSAASKTCPKCGRRMEEGFTIDKGDYSVPTVGSWHRGKPKKSFWGLKTSKADRLEVEVWRCTGCGYLESYAP
jgi:DNA-directed RNA polymerase subunit M/transcription elongation factor TFIIS